MKLLKLNGEIKNINSVQRPNFNLFAKFQLLQPTLLICTLSDVDIIIDMRTFILVTLMSGIGCIGLYMESTDTWNPHIENGGHSRDFGPLSTPIDWEIILSDIVDCAKFSRTLGPTFYTNQQIIDFIKSHKEAYEELRNYFLATYSYRWISITSRIKNLTSLKEKQKQKHRPLETIRDVIGFRFTIPTVSDVRNVTYQLENGEQDVYVVVAKKCYGICHQAPPYKDKGYRRIHLLINIVKYNKTAEIQLGTPYTNFWADWNHDFVYKGVEDNEAVAKYNLDIARYLYQLDELRDKMVSCPFELMNTPVQDSNSHQPHERVPSNLCYFWRDIDVSGFVPSKRKGDDVTHQEDSDVKMAFYAFATGSLITVVLSVM